MKCKVSTTYFEDEENEEQRKHEVYFCEYCTSQFLENKHIIYTNL